jgi:hypothetical protein
MSEKSRLEVMLEAIKILVWPLLILVGVWWLGNDFREMLTTRTWEFGGIIKVGNSIKDLQSALQGALSDQKDFLEQILSVSTDSSKVRDIADKALKNIENAQKGVKSDIQNIKQIFPRAIARESGQVRGESTRQRTDARDRSAAKVWETSGFQYMLKRDIGRSIEAFFAAKEAWPDYHNVKEIWELLNKNKDALRTPESDGWNRVYQEILKTYSWGMPPEVRQAMRKYVGQ